MRRRTVLAATVGVVTGGCVEVVPSDEADASDDSGVESTGSDAIDDSATDTEGSDGRFHESGTIEILIDGDSVDLSADRFQAEHNPDHDIRFHFHKGDERWHMEEERVAYAEAIDLVPFLSYERADGGHLVTFDGRDAGTDVAFRVDGAEVDPIDYELRDGDHLELEIATAD